MLNMSTALSALRANQAALGIIGNNVANANTPEYHRQDLRLVDARPVNLNGILVGQGVEISYVNRAYDAVTEAALTRNISAQGAANAQLQASREIESFMTPGQGTILDRLETLFEDLQRLTAEPDNAANRSIVIRSAQNLTEEINEVARQLDDLSGRLEREIDSKLKFIYERTDEVVKLNVKIREALVRGESPNDLLDRRDQLVNELAEVIDVRIDLQASEVDDTGIPETVLRLADGGAQLLRFPLEMSARTDETTGQLLLFKKGTPHPTDVTQGQLGGLLAARNELVPEYRARLEEFTRGLVTAFDNAHINGVGVTGSFDVLRGERFLTDTSTPLAELDSIVPIESGTIFISVIDPAGIRTVHEVPIDPTVDTLQDIADRFSALDHLEARIDIPPGQFSIRAESGYQFDFVTVQPTQLDTSGITGTVVPQVSGEYKGANVDQYTYEFTGSGTIGVTPGLSLTVHDSVGTLVGEFNVGVGYEVGTEITIGSGIKLSLSTGDVNAGDTFTLKLVHQADSSNFLAATGINTLFAGSSPDSIQVRSDLILDPNKFAVTRSGERLDARNVEAMVALRYAQLLDGGTKTLEENLAEMVGAIGGRVRDMNESIESLQVIGESLRAERDSKSGVDPNEEAVKMLQFQRAYQATARYIVVLDETLQELIGILR